MTQQRSRRNYRPRTKQLTMLKTKTVTRPQTLALTICTLWALWTGLTHQVLQASLVWETMWAMDTLNLTKTVMMEKVKTLHPLMGSPSNAKKSELNSAAGNSGNSLEGRNEKADTKRRKSTSSEGAIGVAAAGSTGNQGAKYAPSTAITAIDSGNDTDDNDNRVCSFVYRLFCYSLFLLNSM